MEVKNGIIIDGVLHEDENIHCNKCSLKDKCWDIDDGRLSLCDIFKTNGFTNRGKVKVEREEE